MFDLKILMVNIKIWLLSPFLAMVSANNDLLPTMIIGQTVYIE
jgi:hypothetical protein